MAIKTKPTKEDIEAAMSLLPTIDLVQPTPAERRNGWTAQTLTAYLRRRQAEAARFHLAAKKNHTPRVENHFGFDPFRW
jgi:hypothetical protein